MVLHLSHVYQEFFAVHLHSACLMSASDNLQHEQLGMFMPARALKARVQQSDDLEGRETMDQMWARKSKEAALPAGTEYRAPYGYDDADTTTHGTGVRDSMMAKGYDGPPISVSHEGERGGTMVWDGHHRVAVAAELNLDVAVEHSNPESRFIATSSRSRGVEHDVRLASDRKSADKRLAGAKERLKGVDI